jgi:hypothetical protein
MHMTDDHIPQFTYNMTLFTKFIHTLRHTLNLILFEIHIQGLEVKLKLKN